MKRILGIVGALMVLGALPSASGAQEPAASGAVAGSAADAAVVETGAPETGAIEPSALERDALERDAVESSAFEPGALEPGALENAAESGAREAAESSEETADVAEASEPSVAETLASLAEATEQVHRREHGVVLFIEGGASFLTALMDADNRSLTLEYAIRGGYRFGDWSVLLHVEHGLWRAPELGGLAWQQALNVGVAVERFYVSGFLRSMVTVGPSILLRSNDLDDSGDTGLFLDFRPLGIHWQLTDTIGIELDLLHLSLVAPVLSGVPLADVQFRSSVSLEWHL